MGKRGMRQEVGARTVIKMRAEEKAHVGNNFFWGGCFKGLGSVQRAHAWDCL